MKSKSAAFTILEVLVAMTMLVVMMLMVMNMFQGSSQAWNIGTQKADMNNAARAALDFMARELESAVAGPILAANAESALQFRVEPGGKEVFFVTLTGEIETPSKRALRSGVFYLADNCLRYARQTDSFHPISNNVPTKSGAGMLITNVLDLSVAVYANFDSSVSLNDFITSNNLPLCVDLALELLSVDDMKRYQALSGSPADQSAFRYRNAKVYSTRVYFPNRRGYGAQ